MKISSKTSGGKIKVGITLSKDTFDRLEELVKQSKDQTGILVTKSQLLSKLINEKYIEIR